MLRISEEDVPEPQEDVPQSMLHSELPKIPEESQLVQEGPESQTKTTNTNETVTASI